MCSQIRLLFHVWACYLWYYSHLALYSSFDVSRSALLLWTVCTLPHCVDYKGRMCMKLVVWWWVQLSWRCRPLRAIPSSLLKPCYVSTLPHAPWLCPRTVFCTITGAFVHSAWSQLCFVRCRSLQPPMAWIRCFHGVSLLRCGPPRSLRGALQAVLSSSTTMCCTEFSIQLMRLGANVS